jgi:nuclear pore complex protein Nup155
MKNGAYFQVEQFSHVQCNCMIGLFPEIERAWLTIDSDIYVWRFEDQVSGFY